MYPHMILYSIGKLFHIVSPNMSSGLLSTTGRFVVPASAGLDLLFPAHRYPAPQQPGRAAAAARNPGIRCPRRSSARQTACTSRLQGYPFWRQSNAGPTSRSSLRSFLCISFRTRSVRSSDGWSILFSIMGPPAQILGGFKLPFRQQSGLALEKRLLHPPADLLVCVALAHGLVSPLRPKKGRICMEHVS